MVASDRRQTLAESACTLQSLRRMTQFFLTRRRHAASLTPSVSSTMEEGALNAQVPSFMHFDFAFCFMGFATLNSGLTEIHILS